MLRDTGDYYLPSLNGRYILMQDGKEILRGTEIEIWKELHKRPYSVHHALKYEGYSIRPEVFDDCCACCDCY